MLYKQAGFGPGQDYERETVPSRGLFDSWSANHLLHLVDGIPMNDNLYGTAYTWEVSPLFMAKSLEIIRGPGSALYGSNATNGVVQVNTISAADLPKNFHFRAQRGDQGRSVYDAVAGHQTDHLDFVVGYQSYASDGFQYTSFDGSGRFDADNNLSSYELRDDRTSSYLWSKLAFRGAAEGLSVQYHEQAWNFQTGHGWLFWIPDFKEQMEEKRQILTIKYAPQSKGRFSQEYALRHQRHDINWLQRYYPDDAFEGYYPSGMWEYLDTDATDTFIRAQGSYQFAKNATILAGFEGVRFSYGGDDAHYSNVNVDSPFFEPFPGDRNTSLGPWLDYIADKPMINTAIYAQFTSGDLLGARTKLTLGVRSDELSVDYRRVYEPGQPEGSRSFSRVSPRLALVFLANEDLSFKLMAGDAFRAPMPTELAGAHTFSLASNIEELKPELISTTEAAVDWRINKRVNLRANIFRTEFENQIAYSTQNNNLSTNVFSQTTSGLETELYYKYRSISGFFNYSLARREDETVLDNTIAASPDEVTWEPDTKINFGITYTRPRLTISLAGHYQGSVTRRASDIGVQTLPLGVGVDLDMDAYRPQQLPAWTTFDSHIGWRINSTWETGLDVRNLLDEKDHVLAKAGPFPFDYRQSDRTANLYLKVTL